MNRVGRLCLLLTMVWAVGCSIHERDLGVDSLTGGSGGSSGATGSGGIAGVAGAGASGGSGGSGAMAGGGATGGNAAADGSAGAAGGIGGADSGIGGDAGADSAKDGAGGVGGGIDAGDSGVGGADAAGSGGIGGVGGGSGAGGSDGAAGADVSGGAGGTDGGIDASAGSGGDASIDQDGSAGMGGQDASAGDDASVDQDSGVEAGACVDRDGDGYGVGCSFGFDCDDSDPLVHQGAPELPDDGIDQDCAGDGDLVMSDATGIFVDQAVGDDTAGLGTMAAPYKTVLKGVSVADVNGKDLFVAQGTYQQHEFTTNHSLFGGYRNNAGQWTRDIKLYETIINKNAVASTGGTLHLSNVGPIAIQGFTVTGTACFWNEWTVDVADGGHASFVRNRIVGSSCGASYEGSALTIAGYGVAVGNEIYGGAGGVASSAMDVGRGAINSVAVLWNNLIVAGSAGDLSPWSFRTVDARCDSLSCRLIAVNNTIVGAPVLLGTNAQATMINNVIHGGSAAHNCAIYGSDTTAWSLRLLNNDFWGTNQDGFLCGYWNGTATQNTNDVGVINGCSWSHCQQASSNMAADPLFVGAGDYHLASGSPCVDSATGDTTDFVVPSADKDAIPRVDDVSVTNTGAGTPPYVDIGAFERSVFVPASPSCSGGLMCNGESCCTSIAVPGGTFPMGRATEDCGTVGCQTGAGNEGCPNGFQSSCWSSEQPEHPMTVGTFVLDKFEVTVGRFRNFVTAYADGWRPTVGGGKNPNVTVGDTSWQSGWDDSANGGTNLPLTGATAAATHSNFAARLNCATSRDTWTDAVGGNEDKAITCMNWYEAFAFCIWDGGRLPTEAEWEYASAGGDENRLFPWGSAVLDCTRANYANGGTFCEPGGTETVSVAGARPAGNGRWGHADMAGNVYEWNFDCWYDPYPAAQGNNYANTTPGTYRIYRGGSVGNSIAALRAAMRGYWLATDRNRDLRGLRCARDYCIAESDAAFCARVGKTCGSVNANDNCGTGRTVASCGTCSGAGVSCVAGSCAPETDAGTDGGSAGDATADSSAPQISWVQKTPMPTLWDWGSTAITNGKIVALGGHDVQYCPQYGTCKRVSAYDPVGDQWTDLASWPRADGRYASGVGVVGSKVYLFAGVDCSGSYQTNSVDVYDTLLDSWTLDVAVYPYATSGMMCATIAPDIYCFGAWVVTNTVAFRFTTGNRTFTPLPAMPTGRSSGQAVAVGDKIYVIGGWGPAAAPVTVDVVEIFDTTKGTWASASPMPIAARDFVAGVIGGRIYVVGGQGVSSALDSVQVYDPVLDRWETGTPLPLAMGGGFGGVLGNTLYTMGGMTSGYCQMVANNYQGTLIGP